MEIAQSFEQPEGQSQPVNISRRVYLLLAAILGMVYLVMQLVLVIPLIFYIIAVEEPATQDELTSLVMSEQYLWMSVLIMSLTGLATIIIAGLWPHFWKLVGGKAATFKEWFTWERPKRLPLWSIPLITLFAVFGLTYSVDYLLGSPEVSAQMEMFNVPLIQQLLFLPVVVIIAPIAEEIIFRGALYDALLLKPRPDLPEWGRHLPAVLLTGIPFGLVHLMAGFETLSSVVAVIILGIFLGALRAITGSLRPSVVAHITWNFVGGVALILSYHVPGLDV